MPQELKPKIMKKIITSLIQPTGRMHLGNYLGAIRQWVELQEGNTCHFGVANYHAITTEGTRMTLRRNTKSMVFDLLALGIKPKNLFVQSEITKVTELSWLLTPFVSYKEMSRMTQYKDKVQNGKPANMGLFSYPILQAADILIHGTDLVPVGKDQLQHLELAKSIAIKFNTRYGDVLTIPKPHILEDAHVMSLKNPLKKMSKSLPDNHNIYLDDSEVDIRKKINKMVTDSGELKGTDAMTPGVKNMFYLLSQFDELSYKKHYIDYLSGPMKYGDVKKALANALVAFTQTFQKEKKKIKMSDLMDIQVDLLMSSYEREINVDNFMENIRERIGLVNSYNHMDVVVIND